MASVGRGSTLAIQCLLLRVQVQTNGPGVSRLKYMPVTKHVPSGKQEAPFAALTSAGPSPVVISGGSGKVSATSVPPAGPPVSALEGGATTADNAAAVAMHAAMDRAFRATRLMRFPSRGIHEHRGR
jgi:hypothetical protein